MYILFYIAIINCAKTVALHKKRKQKRETKKRRTCTRVESVSRDDRGFF
jgi:hypothetical protein